MKLSINWLKDHIELDKNTDQIADILTNAGLEVEGQEAFSSLKSSLEGVVVGDVKSVVQHPNADKLKLTQVDIGAAEYLHIVCGAPNVAQGQKVPVATIGTKLIFPDGAEIKIKRGKIRGEVSEGMICAEDELGLGNSHDGIMVLDAETPIGTAITDHVNVYRDDVLEIGLTPNRVDAACHRGSARDLAAVLGTELKEMGTPAIPIAHSNPNYSIQIESPERCPRYSALVISGIEIKDSPQWLKDRLTAIGIQPKNNVVDITNYVMHDIGQPLHAFDLKEISGNTIKVRNAFRGEKFTTLDEKERELTGDELMICNNAEPMAIAGVLGGLKSGISNSTTDILLESAYFNPSTIRKSAKHHQIHTDASFRFERGVDPNNTIRALELAAKLIIESTGGQLDSSILDVNPLPIHKPEIEITYQYINQLAGFTYSQVRLKEIFKALGIEIKSESEQGMKLSIPTNKPDVLRPCDIVEEVMRIEGYNQVPFHTELSASLPSNNYGSIENIRKRVVQQLNGLGFHQIKTNPLETVESEKQVQIANPLSREMSALRTSVLNAGLPVLTYNINRQSKNLKFFELANEFQLEQGASQQVNKLVLWTTGNQMVEESWYQKNKPTDTYYLNGVVTQLLNAIGIKIHTRPVIGTSFFEYALEYYIDDLVVGHVGQVSRQKLKGFDIDQAVCAADLDFGKLLDVSSFGKVQYQTPSKFPFVTRDLSFLLKGDIHFAEIERCIWGLKQKFLTSITCFDVYKGNKTDVLVSYAIRLKFENDEKTLKDKQVDFFMGEIMKTLEQLGCEIRK